MLDFFMSFYNAFKILNPLAGLLLVALGVMFLIDGNSPDIGVYLLLAGVAQLVCSIYIGGVTERVNRGEALSSGEKPFTLAAMTVLIVIGGALFLAWEAVKLAVEAVKDSFR